MGVRPTDDSGCMTGGHPDGIVLSFRRRFEPEFVGLDDVRSIGSGNNVELYMKELEALRSDSWTIMQGEVGQPGGMGRARSRSLARFLLQTPAKGMSRYVHSILVWRNRVQIEPLNLIKFSADGTKTENKMPQVANGWAEYVNFANRAGLSAVAARA